MAQIRQKILFLVTQSNFGGAQKYVFDLATNLDKQRYEIAVAAGGNGELFKRIEVAGVQIFKLRNLDRSISIVGDLIAYFEIKKMLKKWQPDILHLNSSKAAVLGSLAAKKLPIKVIYTVHGAVFEASFSCLARNFFLWLEKLTAKYKDKIICVSENDKALWLKYSIAPQEKLINVRNGINLNINFLSKEEARQKLLAGFRHQFLDYQLIGFVGYFYPEKNLSTLIEAASLILNNPKLVDRKILFVLVGDGLQENILKLKVQDLNLENKVLFLGAVPQAQKYLKAFDVFTLPSVKEGMPYTILEAMAAGLPIVASNVGGIPEMISDNNNGFLINPGDFEALAERILQILEKPDLAQRFSRASLEKVKEFSLEKMVEQTQEQY